MKFSVSYRIVPWLRDSNVQQAGIQMICMLVHPWFRIACILFDLELLYFR